MKILFIGDASDFHILDKFNQATCTLKDKDIFLFSGASIENNRIGTSIVNYKHLIRYDLSRLLFNKQLKNSQFIKNILKACLYPFQIGCLRYYIFRNDYSIFHAFTMYNAALCYFARLKCVVTPQGSEVLQRMDRSKIYRFFAIKALRYANGVVVDSKQMQDKLLEYNVYSSVFKNGFNTRELLIKSVEPQERDAVVSIRGLRPLYQIHKIIAAQKSASSKIDIQFVYPSLDIKYGNSLSEDFYNIESNVGMLPKKELYHLLRRSKLVISIPETDSSPRSVYEAIFAGAAVAVTYSPYLEELPSCMRKRILVVNLENENWLVDALAFSDYVIRQDYIPSEQSLDMCDQGRTMLRISEQFYN